MWERLLRRVLPMDVYREIRWDIVEIYIAAYRQRPDVQAELAPLSDDDLRDIAEEYADAARDYDPYEPINDYRSLVSGIWTVVTFFIVLTVVITGAISGGGYWYVTSRGLLEGVSQLSDILVYLILGTAGTVSVGLGTVYLTIQFFAFSSLLVGTIYADLAIGRGYLRTRRREKVIGITFWNSSLTSNTAFKLLSIFSVLWILSHVPKWDPYGYIVNMVQDHIDVVDSENGLIAATKAVVRRIREKNEDDEE